MKESINFTYDGQSNEKFGVYLANIGGGLYNEPFLPNRKIVEKRIASREKPYFQGMEASPLQFSITIVIKEWDLAQNKRAIARWLFQDYYKPLIFESNPERVFYALIEGDAQLHHNGITTGVQEQAYVTLNVRCDSPYAYTPEYPLPNIKFREGKKEKLLRETGNQMLQGESENLKFADGGFEIDTVVKTWGHLTTDYTYWGDLY